MKETIQSGHLDADQLSAFVEHALPAHEHSEMLAHLAVCSECRATLAMLIPETDVVAKPAAEPKLRPWFIGWRLLWPAVAAATALAAFVLLVDRKPSGQQKDEPRQMVVLRTPEAPHSLKPTEDGKTTRSAEHAAVNADKKRMAGISEVKQKNAGSSPGATFAANAALQPNSREEPIMRPATSLAIAPAALESPTSVPQVPTGGTELLQSASSAALIQLPTGQPVLSMARQGALVLAVDAQNAVFVSNDGGAHWHAVPTAWKGRAVRADLVHYGAVSNLVAPISPNGGVAQFAAANRLPQQQRQEANIQSQTANQDVSLSQAEDRDAGSQAQIVAAPARNQEQYGAPPIASGRLHGTVTDMTGAAIPGAKVTVTEPGIQTTRITATNQDGTYILDRLAPGSYEMKTEAQGFEQQTRQGIDVKNGQLNVANVALQVGAMSETVTVEDSDSALTETQSMTLAESAVRQAEAKSVPAPPIFELTTDSGDHWVSANGMTWRRK